MFDALRGVWVRRKLMFRALLTRAFLLTAFAALGACAHAFEVAPGYSIKEIPYAGSPFYWIDNESVIFNAAHRTSTDDSIHGSSWSPPALYKWNTRTNQVFEVMKTGKYTRLCYDRGYLYVSFTRDDGDRIVRRGPLGTELETVVIKKGETKFPFSGYFNRYSCRWEERPKATQSDRGVIEILRDDHGFIEAEHPRDPFPNRRYFLVPPSRAPIPIDFHGASGAPQYSSFKSAYAFKESISEWGATLGLKYWLVHPSGRVELTQIPPGEWRTGSVYAMPIRDSWFMTSLSMTPSAVGGYVVNHNTVRLVIKGRINSFDVSPDGCRIAIYAQPAPRVAPGNAVLEVCRER